MSRPGLQPPNLVLKWVKRVEDDVDHSLASSAKVKNEWTYSSTPLTHLQGANRDIVFIFFNLCFVLIYFHLQFCLFSGPSHLLLQADSP